MNKAITDWRVKWVPAICSFAKSQSSKGVKAVLAQEKDGMPYLPIYNIVID